jgi:hypothetical protein
MRMWGIILFLFGVVIFQLNFIGLDKSLHAEAVRPGSAQNKDDAGIISSAASQESSSGEGYFYDVVAGLCSIVGVILALWD